MFKKLIKILDNFARAFFPLPTSKLEALKNMPGACVKEKEVDGTVIYSLFRYKDPAVQKIILDFKRNGYKEYANFFAQALFDFLLERLSGDLAWTKSHICIVPIPLHKSKLKKRGFNQNELILKSLSEKITNPQIKFCSTMLTRVRKTKDQKNLSRQERKENVKDAFEVKQCKLLQNLELVIVLDDIVTSGATLLSAKTSLKKAGYKGKVLLLAISKS